MHWAYATLSAALFLALMTQTFPNDTAGPSRLIYNLGHALFFRRDPAYLFE